MLPVQEAVRQSVKTFAELYPPDIFRDLRLEEVSISEDERTRQVMLSYRNTGIQDGAQNEDAATASFLRLGGWPGSTSRLYKTVTLDASDGFLVSVKNAR